MTFPNQITATFNKPITLQTGVLSVYKDGSLFLTFTHLDIVVIGNTFTIDVSNLFPNNGDYQITMTASLFKSGVENSQAVNLGDWEFSIQSAQYASSDYNSDYLI